MSEIPSIFRCRPRLAAVTAGVVLCLLAATFPSQAAKEAVPSFFNSKEVKSDNLKPFKKWNAALARYSKESADKLKGDCKATKLNKCHYTVWMKFLKGIRGKVLVLDNQIKQVIEARKVRHYQPVFSVNSKSWWRHRV